MNSALAGQPVEILLVEDNPGDVELTRQGLKEGKIHNNLHVARDGEEALAFLRRQGTHVQAPRPDLILLDLNMPRKDGRQVLAEIKADASLRTIPIVVLTSSSAEEDIVKSYDLQASCYVIKPLSFDRYVQIVKCIEHLWFSIVSGRS